MNYEKKYKEALSRARQFSEHPLQEDSDSIVEYIFPELKESEDERIRKAIHIYLDWLDGRNKDYQPKGDYSIKDMIAWLEKQGEQKSAWSEEDEKIINHLLDICESAKKFIQFASCTQDDITKCQDWLTSLKQKIE